VPQSVKSPRDSLPALQQKFEENGVPYASPQGYAPNAYFDMHSQSQAAVSNGNQQYGGYSNSQQLSISPDPAPHSQTYGSHEFQRTFHIPGVVTGYDRDFRVRYLPPVTTQPHTVYAPRAFAGVPRPHCSTPKQVASNSQLIAECAKSNLVREASQEQDDRLVWRDRSGNVVAETDVPFTRALALQNQHREIDPQLIQVISKFGGDISPNYHGEIDLANLFLPEYLNCCLFLTGIHPMAELVDLLAQFSKGKIFISKLYPPVPGEFETSAAKIAFTTREAAEALFNRANSPQPFAGLYVLGKRVEVIWNRDKYRPIENSAADQSRVIQIWGPEAMETEKIVEGLSQFIKFDLLLKREWTAPSGLRVCELHFPSILGQSRAAVKCLREYFKIGIYGHEYSVHFAPDPCAQRSSN